MVNERGTSPVDDHGPNAEVEAARGLARALEAGEWPPYIQPPVQMWAGEGCFAQAPVQLSCYFATDVEWVVKSTRGFGILPVVMKAGNAMGNQARKSAAEARAAAQWRPVGQGAAYFTTMRILIRDDQWWWINYDQLMVAQLQEGGLLLEWAGADPFFLHLQNAAWYFVLIQRLAYGQIVHL